MTASADSMLSGLPDQARRLLAAPPLDEKMLLELSARWPALPASIARTAAALRMFVITWDPLERLPDRPDAYATSSGYGADLEIVVYVPIWKLTRMAVQHGHSVAAELSTLAGSAAVVAARTIDESGSDRHPDNDTHTAAPDLLADPAAGAALGEADIRLVSPAWESIGLGAITDAVQQAFGVVDLDRSLVELAPVDPVRLGCPACAGQRFGFLADLGAAQTRMCPSHAAQAQAVTKRRLARANVSNPRGWAAIGDASTRLSQPHLPHGLAGRLSDLKSSVYVIPENAELIERAGVVVEAADWFVGRAEDFAVALGEDSDLAGLLPTWLMNLTGDLGRAGLASEAVRVSEAMSRVAPDRQSEFESELAVAMALAGQADQARARIASNLDRWPDDLEVVVGAGDALLALSDVGGAAAHFHAALLLAEADDDFEARADIMDRLIAIQRAGEGPPVRQARHQPRHKPSRAQRTHHQGGGRRK